LSKNQQKGTPMTASKKKLKAQILGAVLGGALLVAAPSGCGGAAMAEHAHNVAAGVASSR